MEPSTLLRVTPGQDPALLRDFLAAHFAFERASLLRGLLVHILAALSVLVWLAALRPGWLGAGAKDSVLGAWAVFAVGAAFALAAEVRLHGRSVRLQRRLDGEARPGP